MLGFSGSEDIDTLGRGGGSSGGTTGTSETGTEVEAPLVGREEARALARESLLPFFDHPCPRNLRFLCAVRTGTGDDRSSEGSVRSTWATGEGARLEASSPQRRPESSTQVRRWSFSQRAHMSAPGLLMTRSQEGTKGGALEPVGKLVKKV